MPGTATATQLVCSFCVEVEKALKFAVAEAKTRRRKEKRTSGICSNIFASFAIQHIQIVVMSCALACS